MSAFKIHILLLLALILGFRISSQTKEFFIPVLEGRSMESDYKKILLLDLRYDTLDNGFILQNRKKLSLVIATSFRKQLSDVLNSLIDTSGARGTLLLVLRKFKLVERNDIDFEYGYCFMRASIFAKAESNYKRINDIDTLITLKDSEVTDTLLNDARNNFVNLIARSLKTEVNGKPEYTYNDIVQMDDHEKKIIPIYNNNTFTDGIYLSWNSFSKQKPDYTGAQLSYKWNTNVRIKVKDKEGKLLKLSGNEIYGFVDKNIPYVCTDYGACIVEKKNNELFYIGKSKITPDNEEYSVSITLAELLGSNTAKVVTGLRPPFGLFISRIDHVDGSFMRVKKIR